MLRLNVMRPKGSNFIVVGHSRLEKQAKVTVKHFEWLLNI